MIKEIILTAKNGYSIQAGETTLHSRYDPALEAEKYIASLQLKPNKVFILVEPGLHYIAEALKKKFPISLVISLHCSSFYSTNQLIQISELSWSPASKEPLENFLEQHIGNTEAEDIKLIDWKPSVNAYGNACLDLAKKTVECIRRITAEKKTIRTFGKCWLKNAFHNINLFKNLLSVKAGSAPVLVCASGPSLEDFLPEIAQWQENPSPPFIISVASAAPVLYCRGIIPDVIISTDGGKWALFHLIEFIRKNKSVTKKTPVIAASLTAALPSQTEDFPFIVLRDGSLWQDVVLHESGYFHASIPFPQRGTVSVSALDLAFYISSGNVFICGLDFSHRDLLTHARPNAFEKIPLHMQNRIVPLYSQFFMRENAITNGESHKIYSEWFYGHLSQFPHRLYSLGKSVHGIPLGYPAENNYGKIPDYSSYQITPKKINCVTALENGLQRPDLKKALLRELGELLLPDLPPAAIDSLKIKKALEEVCCV